MENEFKELLAVAENPGEYVSDWKTRTGGKVIGSLPIYVPEEIIHATGALPVKLWGGKTELERVNTHLQSFACSIVRAVLEYWLKGTYNIVDGFVFPSTCDHIQNTSDIFAYNFPEKSKFDLVYPENRKSKAAKGYLLNLLKDFKDWTEQVAGEVIDSEKLSASIKIFNIHRELMADLRRLRSQKPASITGREMANLVKASFFLPKEKYNRKMQEILPWLKKREVKGEPRARIVLTGIAAEPEEILDIMDNFGLAVVGDDLALGERVFRVQANESLEPLESLAQRHFSLGPCSTIFDPLKTRGTYILKLVQETKADGVVFINMKFCEREEFDYPILKKEMEQAGIPLLFIEVEQQMSSFSQISTRLQAFLEMMVQGESK